MNTAQSNTYKPTIVFHPGETLQEKLDELGIGSTEFAVRTGKPAQTISNVLNGKSSITPEMAVLFEAITRIPASFWQKKQARYDEYMAKQKRALAIVDAVEWAKSFPYAKMASAGWVIATRKPVEKVERLFAFFNIAVKEAWEDFFMKKKLAVNFRISLHGTKDPYALSAWIRQGEILAAQQSIAAYDASKLKAALPSLKEYMATCDEDFWTKSVSLLADCGVKIVSVPCLPNVSANGVSRWINKSPIIQLSDRMKRYDVIWFSLWHEIGHILMHGSKHISVENVDYDDRDMKIEQEADDFAIRWTLTEREEEQFIRRNDFSKMAMTTYAADIGTHPSMIAGRLARKRIITHQAMMAMGVIIKTRIAK